MNDRILVHTINIDLPDKLLNEYHTKKGRFMQKEIDPLTKTGNLKRVRKQLVVNLHTVKDLKIPKIYIEDEKREREEKEVNELEKKPKIKKQKININELPKPDYQGLEDYIVNYDKKKDIKKIEKIFDNHNNKKLQDELNSKLSKFKNTFNEGAKMMKQERGKTKLKELLKEKLKNIRDKNKIKYNILRDPTDEDIKNMNKENGFIYLLKKMVEYKHDDIHLFFKWFKPEIGEIKREIEDFYHKNKNNIAKFDQLEEKYINDKFRTIYFNTERSKWIVKNVNFPKKKLKGITEPEKQENTVSTEFNKKDIEELRNEFNEEIIKQYRIAASKDDLMNYKNYYNETKHKLFNDFINKHMDIIRARYDNFINKIKNTDSHISIKKYISNHEDLIMDQLFDESSYNNHSEKYDSFMKELSGKLSILKRVRTQKSKDEVNESIEKLIYKNNLPSKLLEIFTFEFKNKDEFKYSNFRLDDYYCFNKFQFIYNKKNREKNDRTIII
jgi:hypothetical protein